MKHSEFITPPPSKTAADVGPRILVIVVSLAPQGGVHRRPLRCQWVLHTNRVTCGQPPWIEQVRHRRFAVVSREKRGGALNVRSCGSGVLPPSAGACLTLNYLSRTSWKELQELSSSSRQVRRSMAISEYACARILFLFSRNSRIAGKGGRARRAPECPTP